MRDIERWIDIDAKRVGLLSKSDWTQLPDSGLSKSCVIEWKVWRGAIRKVNKDIYDKPLVAVVVIKELQDNSPKKVYADDTAQVASDGPIIPQPKEKTIDDIRDLPEGKIYGKTKLEVEYRSKILKASPPLELSFLYSERLSQAIDYLSDNGTVFPLLDVLSESLGKSTEEVAVSILKKQTNTINSFATIERGYIECLKDVNKSATMSNIKEALVKFNGY
jgi:hypothetical protein